MPASGKPEGLGVDITVGVGVFVGVLAGVADVGVFVGVLAGVGVEVTVCELREISNILPSFSLGSSPLSIPRSVI
jgi:hypothetical protein